MIEYRLLQQSDNQVLFEIEDSTHWSSKREIDIKRKQLSIQEANIFLSNTKEQRLNQLKFITELINKEIESIDLVIDRINASK